MCSMREGDPMEASGLAALPAARLEREITELARGYTSFRAVHGKSSRRIVAPHIERVWIQEDF
jgi:hypothetical protein